MTAAAPGRGTAGLGPGGRRRVLVVLCLTETTSWGVLFYAYPVLAATISADTGWSRTGTAAAFSLALVLAGVVGIPAGRWLDRSGPRPLMTAGSLLAAVAVPAIAVAPTLPWFVAAWTLAGASMAGVLYAPAFAALTRWWAADRLTALTALTLTAGLASTVFAPLTGALADRYGWRGCYLVLAGILAVVTVPGHLLGLRGPWPAAPDQVGEPSTQPARRPARQAAGQPSGQVAGWAGDVATVPSSRPFLLLLAVYGIASLSESAVVVHQVSLLVERGLSAGTAAWALGLGGFGQVLGRLGYRRLAAATSPGSRTVGVLLAATAATGALALLPGPGPLLIGLAVLAGTARGLFTLLGATAVTDRWGAGHYGRLNGLLSAPMMLAGAAAPWVGAAGAQALGGYPPMFGWLAALLALAAVLVPFTLPRTGEARSSPSGGAPMSAA